MLILMHICLFHDKQRVKIKAQNGQQYQVQHVSQEEQVPQHYPHLQHAKYQYKYVEVLV